MTFHEPAAGHSAFCSIVPPYLLQQIAVLDGRADFGDAGGPSPRAPQGPSVLPPDQRERVAEAARRTMELDEGMRRRREVFTERGRRDHRDGRGLLPGPRSTPGAIDSPALTTGSTHTRSQTTTGATETPSPHRSIHDAKHGTTLPGTLVRAEGASASKDVSVNQAYDGLGDTWQLYWQAYQRNSLDGKGLPLVATVHYERNYDNAFWDGDQMVFGDGDGTYFNGFTSSVDVIGHELTHGVTQFTAGLTYVGQSGALNESISDCFGSMVKQHSLGESAAEADWLIGEGLFTSKVKGVALRSMKAPGTAYDDPVLGKDPQPADMDGYADLPHDADHDNGGVHTNSGIPNRAFYLAATGIGGTSWEGAGAVWYDVLTSSGIPKDLDFAGFAQRTVDAAAARFGASSAAVTAVREAWETVKVLTPQSFLR